MAKVLDDARATGAKVATGGERVGTDGNFFAPTVLTDVPLEADVFNNEPFGPIAAIRGFDTLEEAIAEANRLPYGLAGYAFTQSIKNAHLLSQQHGSRHAVDQPAGHAVARNAVRRRQGFGLRLGRRPGSDGGLPGHQGGVDHGGLSRPGRAELRAARSLPLCQQVACK